MRRSYSLPKLLLVILHPGLRALLSAQLAEEGYRVNSVETLEEALARLRDARFRADLLILDTLHQRLTLDALDGIPTDLALLVCTGPLDPAAPLLEQRPRTATLRKPFTIRELVDAVHEICYKGP